MAEKNNATCSICEKPYYVCMGCRDTMQLQPWKIHCCSPDCYRTFQVVKGFSTGVYTKDEFKSKLKNIDLSNLENYREHIKALIKDVLKEEPSVVEKSMDTNDAIEEKVVVKKQAYSRKRSNKVNNEAEE